MNIQKLLGGSGFLLGALTLMVPLSTGAQLPCGNIITEEFGEQEVRPVVDCTDPFMVTVNPTALPPSFVSVDGEIDNSDVLTATTSPIAIPVSVEFGDPQVEDISLVLYSHDDSDYVQVNRVSVTDNNAMLTVQATGTYTLVAEAMVRKPQFVYTTRPNWLIKLQHIFIPVAHAQVIEFPFTFETFVLTFVVELSEPDPEPLGASSVLFLPGIQASRLYTDGVLGAEDQLWEPNNSGDIRQLEMDINGHTINDIYTRDTIDEALGVIDIYDSFLDTMENLETEQKIVEFLPFAYDWRYGVFDVATQPIQYPNGEQKILVDEILRMAGNSNTGKVTIVAHSNGGLVTKALLSEYGDNELMDKIDKIVFVGAPETGAPKAIAALLHGYDQGSPANVIVNDSLVRTVSKNLPGAYGLLPSQTYIANNSTPLVFFDSSDSTSVFRSMYGNAVNDLGELTDFVLGVEGRSEAQDVSSASLGNPLLSNRAVRRAQQLDELVIPAEIDTYSILGNGKETEVAFEYREFSERICETEFLIEVCSKETFYRPVPILSFAGDGTVPSQSSINGFRHYVDLSGTDFDHKNLTESPAVQSFIAEIISATGTIPTYSIAPVYDDEFLLIGLHSPMEMLLIDDRSRKSGMVDGELLLDIPNTTYRELAGARYITIPKDELFTIQLQGVASGGATLTLDEFSGAGASSVAALPIAEVSTSTRAILEYDKQFSPLEIDSNGDGVVDIRIGLDGEVILNNDTSYDVLKQIVADLNLSQHKKKALQRTIAIAEKYNNRDSKKTSKIERRILQLLQFKIKWLFRADIITKSEYRSLRAQVKVLIRESKK